MGVLLTGHASFFTDCHEAGCGFGAGAVTLVGIALDHRAGIDQRPMAGLVGGWEIGVPGMGHVSADEKAAGQHAALIFGVEAGIGRQTFDDIRKKTATRPGGAFRADFLVVKKGAEASRGRVFGRQQGAQRSMAGGQIVELAIGNEFLTRTPQAALLGVVGIQFPSQQITRLNSKQIGNRLTETRFGLAVVIRNAKQ